jgi:hypothetical protein
MPEKVLKCAGCDCLLGTIELGRLRKDIVFICGNCDNKRLGALMKMEANKHDPKKDYGMGSAFDDLFGDIFGGKKK